jgi:hypothetical protein
MSYEERKLDTRRKIAIGGLVIKAGLDHEDPAVLLGMLLSAARVLSSPNASEHRRRWPKSLGKWLRIVAIESVNGTWMRRSRGTAT